MLNSNPQRDPVLLLAPVIGNETGGIQEFTRELMQALIHLEGPRGVVAMSYAASQPFTRKLLAFDSCKKSPWRKVAFFFKTLRLCHTWKPRLIISTFPGFALAGVACARIMGIRFVTVAHGIEVWSRLSWAKRIALQKCDRILAVSRYTADQLRILQGVESERITIFPNTVDSQVYFPEARNPDLQRHYDLPPGAPVVLTVARLDASERSKGIERVWDAMEKRPDEIMGRVVHLVVGSGSDLERLREEAARRSCGARIRFAGPVSQGGLADIYRLADIYVMPSLKEGFGIVYLEAFASGIPVVAADACGTPDALRDGELGWLVPPDDPEALASAMVEALKSTDRRRDPTFLRQAVEHHFGHPAFRGRLQAILEALAP